MLTIGLVIGTLKLTYEMEATAADATALLKFIYDRNVANDVMDPAIVSAIAELDAVDSQLKKNNALLEKELN